MDSDPQSVHSKFWSNSTFRMAGVTIAVVFVVFLWKVLNIDLDGMLRFPDRLTAFPTVEANYKQIYDKVSGTTSDVWLKAPWDDDFSLELVRGENYKGCIRGGFTRTYGTNRSFHSALADYKNAFPEMNWGEYGRDDSGISGKMISIQIHRIGPSSPDYSEVAGKYQVVYSVSLVYADPAVQYCYA